MTDRELLEAAAQAAGIVLYWSTLNPAISYTDGGDWNPLTDAGDALRLAVALKIHVSPMIATWWEQNGTERKFENDGSEPLADTCRAIVRAAAAKAQPVPDAPACVCREPLTLGVVHRADGPCYLPDAAPVAQQAEPLHVGESQFEGWHSTYNPAGKGDKQRARDAYAASMSDAAAHHQQPVRVPLTPAQIKRCELEAYRQHGNPAGLGWSVAFTRAIEAAQGIVPAPTTDTTHKDQQ